MFDADASSLGKSVNPCRFSWLLLVTSIDPLASLASPSVNSKLPLFYKASKDADNSVQKLVLSCSFMIMGFLFSLHLNKNLRASVVQI